jgi:hypothetical protein
MQNHTYHLYVRTCTPLHIGGEQEKNLTNGFDYFEQKRQNASTDIWKIDEHKVIEKIGIDAYVNALEKGKIGFQEALRQRGLTAYADYCAKIGQIEGSGMELRTMIAEGKTGFPYLPGTSLKGALRSALFKASGGGVSNPSDRDVFGEFANSAMRFLQVGDVYFNHPGHLFNSRVYNGVFDPVSNRWEGSWKYELKSGSNEFDFQDDGFATILQAVPPGQLGKLRLGIHAASLKRYQEMAIQERQQIERGQKREPKQPLRRVPGRAAELIAAKSPLSEFLRMIFLYTKNYLEREIAFFSELRGAKSDLIIQQLRYLQKQNAEKSPLLRIGYGSGYHSVTGDYRVDDHVSTLDRPLELKGRKGKIMEKRVKSRRLAFDFDEEQDEYRFWPLGFVQLLREEDAKPYLEKLKREQESKAQETRKNPEAKKQTVATREETSSNSATEKTPRIAEKSAKQLRKGVKIEGEVVGQEGKDLLVKPYLLGYEDAIIRFRYPVGMAVGTLVAITVSLQGENLVGQGAPRKK